MTPAFALATDALRPLQALGAPVDYRMLDDIGQWCKARTIPCDGAGLGTSLPPASWEHQFACRLPRAYGSLVLACQRSITFQNTVSTISAVAEYSI